MTENARVLAEEFEFFVQQLRKRSAACSILRNKFEFLFQEFSGLKERLVDWENENFVTVASRNDLGKLSVFLSNFCDDLVKNWKDFENGVSQSKEVTEMSAKGCKKSGASFGKCNGSASFYGAHAQTRLSKGRGNVKCKESFSYAKFKNVISDKLNFLGSGFGKFLDNCTVGMNSVGTGRPPAAGMNSVGIPPAVGMNRVERPPAAGLNSVGILPQTGMNSVGMHPQTGMNSVGIPPHKGMMVRDTPRDEAKPEDSRVPPSMGMHKGLCRSIKRVFKEKCKLLKNVFGKANRNDNEYGNRKSAPSKNVNEVEMLNSVKKNKRCSNVDDFYGEGYCEMTFTGGSPEKLCGKGNTDFMTAPFPRNKSFCKEKFADESGPSNIEPNFANFVSKLNDVLTEQRERTDEVLQGQKEFFETSIQNQLQMFRKINEQNNEQCAKLIANLSKPNVGASSAAKLFLKSMQNFDGRNGYGILKFFESFERCQKLSKWDDEEALVWLECFLRGIALREFRSTGPFRTYSDAKNALVTRFLTEGIKEIVLDQISNIKQQKSESVMDYFTRYLELTDLGFHNERNDFVDYEMVRHFIRGLRSSEMQRSAHRLKLKRVDAVAEFCEEEEARCLYFDNMSKANDLFTDNRTNASDFETRKCYRCGARGHLADQCFA